MTEADSPKASKDKEWSLPSWSKISDFVLNVVQLQRTYEGLKADNTKLKEQVERLQRQSDEQAGEMRVLLAFVQTSLREQVESSAERAAARMLERLFALRDDRPDRDR